MNSIKCVCALFNTVHEKIEGLICRKKPQSRESKYSRLHSGSRGKYSESDDEEEARGLYNDNLLLDEDDEEQQVVIVKQ